MWAQCGSVHTTGKEGEWAGPARALSLSLSVWVPLTLQHSLAAHSDQSTAQNRKILLFCSLKALITPKWEDN